MKWPAFLVKAALIFVVLWGIFIYAYGDFYLVDNVVPDTGIEIDEWMDSYYQAGGIAAVIGFLLSIIWFYFGLDFSGDSSISIKYMILWILSFILSFIVAFIWIAASQEGSGLSLFFVGFLAPVGFYLNSLFNSEESVKFIPPLAEHIHK